VVVLSSQAVKKKGDILLPPPKRNQQEEAFYCEETFLLVRLFPHRLHTSLSVVSYCSAKTVWVAVVVAGDRRAACALNSMTSVSNIWPSRKLARY